LGSCSGFARIGAIVTPFIAQVLLKASIHSAISIYGTIALIAAIVSYFLPVETKGREMKVWFCVKKYEIILLTFYLRKLRVTPQKNYNLKYFNKKLRFYL
jgi:hypothetical protein